MKKLLVIFTAAVLFGCKEDHEAILHYPQISDLVGDWEGVSFLPEVNYGLIRFSSEGTGKLAIGMDAGVRIIAKLDSFESREHDFRIRLIMVDEDGIPHDEDRSFFNGVVKNDQLCFYVEEERKDEIELKACFLRLEKAIDIRRETLKLFDLRNG